MREAIRSAYLANETEVVRNLVGASKLDEGDRQAISERAIELVQAVRSEGKVGTMGSFLAEYGLSTDEGVALMCLAEAMLRVPDTLTVDELIRDKITPHDWAAHIGDSGSILINASTWGLMLTGRILDDDDSAGVVGTLHALVRRLGEPVIRRAVGEAMAEMGRQFILGRTIEEAIAHGEGMAGKGYTYSFDMLGEAARTERDALRYHAAYAEAIASIAEHGTAGDIRDNPGISVKLSALHPRYEQNQRETMLPVISDRLMTLARAAKEAGLGFNIDAEEADRLELSLDVIEKVLSDPSLADWDGFGIVVQAYGRRAMPTLDFLYELAGRLDRRIMVRLVKGAYWDMEIKRAQILGLADYPVFTRKAHSDVSYLACARRLLGLTDRIYPQFATHNAHSVAAILHIARDDRDGFEFQRLHGMGDVLHDIVKRTEKSRCRIYAPVGAHRDLLAYLVRRLLENGANSSFVNQIVDLSVPAEVIAGDPSALAEETGFTPHSAIPRPVDILAPRRLSRGWDITHPTDLDGIESGRAPFAAPYQWSAGPVSPAAGTGGVVRDIMNPAKPDEIVGTVVEATAELARNAVDVAVEAKRGWGMKGAAARARILRKVADAYEANANEIFALVAREAGKTLLDGVAEVREAVDFLRYYAGEAERLGDEGDARGVIVCISPWNFPLAIFTGQIAAALAAGNAVVAKPAEQTPLIAARAVAWMLEAGVPEGVIQLLPGGGREVGALLAADPRIAGVCFTGSTEVAKIVDRQLANTAPEAMLIAETGGINAMIVDSTALLEQATRDIVRAAFQSAGQRCSALRMLYVQDDVEVKLLEMLEGAMDVLVTGDPWEISTDVGPIIDAEAHEAISGYIEAQASAGLVVKQLRVPETGFFVPPTVIRVSGIEEVEREVFGPVLHLASFEGDTIDGVVEAVNAKGYGLTFGLHSRIDRRVQRVLDRIHVGNVYVNRDQIGAVVGSQPFGGHRLSGTGPKSGGPNYLPRFRSLEKRFAGEKTAAGPLVSAYRVSEAFRQLEATKWASQSDRISRLRAALRGKAAEAVSAAASLDHGPLDLPGPTGESNQFELVPKGAVLCLGPQADIALAQVVQALAAGNRVVAVAPGAARALSPLTKAPLPVVALDGSLKVDELGQLPIDMIAAHVDREDLPTFRKMLAGREGPILPLVTEIIAPAAYCNERAVCIDTTATGGNASLLTEAGA